jgi:hypothetical protein
MKSVVNGQVVTREDWIGDRAEAERRLAEMSRAGTPPQCTTDREFLKGHVCGSQFEKTPGLGDLYKVKARRAGVDTTGKVYSGGLARFPGDPEAWVSDRGDVQRRLEERGWGSDGLVKVKAREPEREPERPAVAPDLVDQKVLADVTANPELARTALPELREKALEEIRPHWSK